MTRLVAVLGYSERGAPGLHPCAPHVSLAPSVRCHRTMSSSSRAGLDAAARAQRRISWRSPGASLHAREIVDRGARTTLGNAIGVGRATRRLDVDEVVLVTSSWHATRAGFLVRASLLGSGATLRVVKTDEPNTPRHGLRELVAWVAVPVLAVVAARTR